VWLGHGLAKYFPIGEIVMCLASKLTSIYSQSGAPKSPHDRVDSLLGTETGTRKRRGNGRAETGARKRARGNGAETGTPTFAETGTRGNGDTHFSKPGRGVGGIGEAESGTSTFPAESGTPTFPEWDTRNSRGIGDTHFPAARGIGDTHFPGIGDTHFSHFSKQRRGIGGGIGDTHFPKLGDAARLTADLSLTQGCEAGLTPGAVSLTPGGPDARYFSAGKLLSVAFATHCQASTVRSVRT
jgi:hypothetical protein